MAVNKELLEASAARAATRKNPAALPGLQKADDALNEYFDYKIQKKREQQDHEDELRKQKELREDDAEYQDYLKTQDTLEEVKNPDNSPLAYNAGLVSAAADLYQSRRYANNAMGRALAQAGKNIDGSIEDYYNEKELEKETAEEEARLAEEKAQLEKDRQTQVLDSYILQSGENNISQHGTDMYNSVQDQMYDLKNQYLDAYNMEDGPEKNRLMNDIKIKMQGLDNNLTNHSTHLQSYKNSIENDAYSSVMEGTDTKNLMDAYFTQGSTVQYQGKEYNFEKAVDTSGVKMILTDPATNEQIVLDPKEQFASTNMFAKTDGAAMNSVLNQLHKTASKGSSETLSQINNVMRTILKDKNELVSYANDTIPGRGKSMRDDFNDMFPNGIEDKDGNMIPVADIFNPNSAWFKQNKGEDILRDLTTDYYTRVAINGFNSYAKKDAQIIGIEGSDNLGIDNYSETTLGISKEEGNKFRQWVNANYPDYAKKINLSKEGPMNNSYIRKAWQKYGQEYQMMIQYDEYEDMINKYL
tara:strand:- start:7790 stop:9373 length:1584 start_codon:yes stop_codon:yes gene_type:complete